MTGGKSASNPTYVTPATGAAGTATSAPAYNRLQDGDGTTLADVAVVTAAAENQNALVVQAPVLGTTTDAAVVTNAVGTVSAKLRGIVALLVSGIAVAASENHLGEVGGKLTFVAVEFTRPNDTNAYVANDVVSNSTGGTTANDAANIARVASGTGYIVKARVSTDKKSITPRIRVHLFNHATPTLSADNAQWQDKYADVAKRLGYFDLPAMTTGADTTNSDMSRSFDLNLRIPVQAAANRSIYWVLETLDAFTPAAQQKFTLELTMDNN